MQTDVPLCLKRAREEILMALGADSEADADIHRKIADGFVIEAVRVIQREPEREYDWSGLRADV